MTAFRHRWGSAERVKSFCTAQGGEQSKNLSVGTNESFAHGAHILLY